LPVFLQHYLTNDIQKHFDLLLIDSLDTPEQVKVALREEVEAMAFPITAGHPLVGNIMRFFQTSTMLEDPAVQAALAEYRR